MSTNARDLIIYGAGGFGREIASMAESGCTAGRDQPLWRAVSFVDDTPGLKGQIIHGIPCIGVLEDAVAQQKGREVFCHIAIGNNERRRAAALRLAEYGWQSATVVHHSAYLSWEVDLGDGCFVAPHVTISPSVTIGRHVLINTRAAVGHHVAIGDYAQVSLGAALLGHARVERGALIGAHAVVMSNITIGPWATVAVGTPAMVNVAAGHTVSLPLAKTLFKRQHLPD